MSEWWLGQRPTNGRGLPEPARVGMREPEALAKLVEAFSNHVDSQGWIHLPLRLASHAVAVQVQSPIITPNLGSNPAMRAPRRRGVRARIEPNCEG